MWRRSRVVVLAIGVLTLIGCASTVQDWVKPLERFWSHQLDRIKERAERKAAERSKKN